MNKKTSSLQHLLMLLLLFTGLPLALSAQNFTVTGTVVDVNNDPVIGATVTSKGVQGAVTDIDGNYTIRLNNGKAQLTFSYVGFDSQTINVAGRNQIDVTLHDTDITLEQVVVVGYGTQKKVNLTGAVSAVTVDKELSSRSIPNVSSALAGLMPGLAVSQSSGMAGNNSASLVIRGLGTINNASPLVVVDDMPDVDINRLNMNDIESISVLKDATASSVYGSRAANGVILIKTKSGSMDKKTQITFSSSYGWEKASRAYGLLENYPRALTLHQMSAATDPGTNGTNQQFKDGTIDQWLALSMIDPLRYPNTDWFDYCIQTGGIQNYNVSASGANDKSNFYASIGYMKQDGLQINNTFDRYNVRFNFDYKVLKNVTAGVRVDGNWSNYQYHQENGFNGSNNHISTAVAGITPYDPATGFYGTVMAYGETPESANPYAEYMNDVQRQNRQDLNGQFALTWKPFKGLTARVDYGLKYTNDFYKRAPNSVHAYNFQTESYTNKWIILESVGVTDKTSTSYKTLLNGRLNYDTVIAKHHNLSAMFVYSEEYWFSRNNTIGRDNIIHPSLSEINAALTTKQTTGGTSSAQGLRSYIGRVNYTAYDRYLLEFNARMDGSSKFQKGHRYGFFPSAAIGWRFTEEQWLQTLTEKWLNSGKFRLSYGSLGNNSGIGNYQQKEILSQNNYMLGGSIASGFVYSKMLNADLTWEKSTVLNVGLDLTFFKGHLSAEMDYYDRLTTGMLMDSQMSNLLTGAYETPKANLGNLRNRGVELNLTWRNHVRDFNYSVNANFAYNRTNLEKWGEFLDKGNVYIDMPYHFVYGLTTDGLAQTWQDSYSHSGAAGVKPGDVIRLDVNGDGRVDINDKVANPNAQIDRPTTTFALNAKASWRGFDFSMLWSGSTGRKGYWINSYNKVNLPTGAYQSTYDHLNKPWSWENRDGEWPRLGGFSTNQTENDFYLRDLTYFRMKNIMLGYTLPSQLTRRFYVENLRFYFSGENLFTITGYEGLDPEKSPSSGDIYPTTRTYTIGVNVTF